MSGDHASLLAAIFGDCVCKAVFNCTPKLDRYGGILLWLSLLFYMFKALGCICDKYFVPALEQIVKRLRISPDVAGATFMAAGSSAPELFTSLVSTFFIVGSGGVGTIIGSAIFNVLVIIGVTSFVACKDSPLDVWKYPLCRDTVFYVLSVAEMMIILSDDKVVWYEALIMLLSYLVYCIYMKFNSRIARKLGYATDDEDDKKGLMPSWGSDDGGDAAIESPTAAMRDGELGDAEHGIGAESGSSWWPFGSSEAVGGKEAEAALGGGGVSSGSRWSPFRNRSPATPLRDDEQPDETTERPRPPPILVAEAGHGMAPPGGAGDTPTPTKLGAPAGADLAPRASPGDQHAAAPSPSAAPGPAVSPGGAAAGVGLPALSLPPLADAQGTGGPKPALVDAPKAPQPKLGFVDAPKLLPTPWPGFAIGPEEQCLQDRIPSIFRDPLEVLWELTLPTPKRCWLLFTLSILSIGLCTYVMVDAASRCGIILKIPTLVMGLVPLAAGTSIPDAMGSIAVAKLGQGDMAIANALGSNVFDILVGLGLPWLIKCLGGKPIEFDDQFKELFLDIIILLLCLALFLGTLQYNSWQLTRKMGTVLIGFYVAYVILTLVLVATGVKKE